LLDWLNEKPFTTLFIDGNHENFNRLNNDYRVREFHGGHIHEIRSSVLHLMRGEIFNLQGKLFFCFGGAKSNDINDGILNPTYTKKIEQWSKEFKMFRIDGVSWWKEELPNESEMQNGLNNLAKHNNEVDYVITHCAPQSIVSTFSQGLYKPDVLTKYLNDILENTKFSKWFYGHYHDNRQIMSDYIMLYEQIIRIV